MLFLKNSKNQKPTATTSVGFLFQVLIDNLITNMTHFNEAQLQIIDVLVSVFLGIATILFTILAIRNARADNRFDSYLNMVVQFFATASLMTSNYIPGVSGSKLFISYEEDLKKMVEFYKSDKNYAPVISAAADYSMTNEIIRRDTLQQMFQAYIAVNAAELDHYISFFDEVIPTLLEDLKKQQKTLMLNVLKANVSHSEWVFLYIYATVNDSSRLRLLIKKVKPAIAFSTDIYLMRHYS